MILILTAADDTTADRVEAVIRGRGGLVERFDPGSFPLDAEIAFHLTNTGEQKTLLKTREQTIDLSSVSAIWYRRPGLPYAGADMAEDRKDFIEQECNLFIRGLWDTLDCRWFPAPPAVIRSAGHKPRQLQLAGEIGFELPPTLITNSNAELIAFYNEHNGQVISKMSAHAIQNTVGDEFCRYTELVSTRDIAHAYDLKYCPMIFQAYVPKDVELRVTVVGEKVFAAEIHSQTANHTKLDWRKYDITNTPHMPHRLPPNIEWLCVEITSRLGLHYGAIDLILTPDGRYVFIEINPNGQYGWIEDATGLPISEAVVDLLAGETRYQERRERASS